jgi:hypothetical protein
MKKERNNESAQKVAEWFGLKLCLGEPRDRVGNPPTGIVCFDLNGLIWVPEWTTATPSDVLHEACHAVLGPHTLKEETGLMAYEYKVAKSLLKDDDWKQWRRDFSDYGFDWGNGNTEIGTSDDVFESEEWINFCEMDAWSRGWLMDDSSPKQFHGIHKDYLNCKSFAAW